MCVCGCVPAGLVPPQHSSGEDAEAGAPEADPRQPRRGLPETRLPVRTPRLLRRERAAAQLHCEAASGRLFPVSEATLNRCHHLSLFFFFGVGGGSQVDPRRRLTGLEAPRGISPYCLPVINTFVTPVPPPTKRKEPGLKVAPRGRRLRPSTVSAAKANEVFISFFCIGVHASRDEDVQTHL